MVLSAYNGFDFQVDIAGLGNLDRKNHALAMTVIQGRYDTGCEPHEVIPNGSKVFGKLWERWRRLHVEERGRMECPACDGRGFIYLNPEDESDMRSEAVHPLRRGGEGVPVRELGTACKTRLSIHWG